MKVCAKILAKIAPRAGLGGRSYPYLASLASGVPPVLVLLRVNPRISGVCCKCPLRPAPVSVRSRHACLEPSSKVCDWNHRGFGMQTKHRRTSLERVSPGGLSESGFFMCHQNGSSRRAFFVGMTSLSSGPVSRLSYSIVRV